MELVKSSDNRYYFLAPVICLISFFSCQSILAKVCDFKEIGANLNSNKKTYKVRDVRVESAIGVLKVFQSNLNSITPQIFKKPNDNFTFEKVSEGRKLIVKSFEDSNLYDGQQLKINIILSDLQNCTELNNVVTLDVVYKVFTTNFSSYLSRTWEEKNKQIEEPIDAIESTELDKKTRKFITLSPIIEYNRTREFYGGTELIINKPIGFFDKAKLSFSASQKGNVEDASLTGQRTLGKEYLNVAQYEVAYNHSDLVAGNNRLKIGTGRFQFNGVTKPLGESNLLLRYGTAIEGGNQQSNLLNEASSQNSLANSGYGSLKIYVGTTFAKNNFSLAASYGLQLGNDGSSAKVEFTKHIGNLAFTKRWIPKGDPKPGEVHKVTSLDIQLAGGVIQNFGQLPVNERFFGGNSQQNFIKNDDWKILSNPFIRSIPQNQLNSANTIGAIGGTKFISGNLTIARTVWGYPLLFKGVTSDPDFSKALTFAENSSETIITNYFKVKLGLYNEIVTDMYSEDNNPQKEPSILINFKKLQTVIKRLPKKINTNDEALNDDYASRFESLKDNLNFFIPQNDQKDGNPIVKLGQIPNDGSDPAAQLSGILNDGPECTEEEPSECGIITATIKLSRQVNKILNDNASKLNISLTTDQLVKLSNDIGDLVGKVDKNGLEDLGKIKLQQKELIERFNKINTQPAIDLAKKDMKDVRASIDAITKELNIIALSPVGIFDFARVFPDKYSTRFGAGGGIRVSVVNFNVTLGYVFNLNRKPNESRGAITFSLDVNDIFR